MPNPKTGSHEILWRELQRLALAATALYLLLALASYSPTDPSWSTWSSRDDFHNWMGRTGSILGDLLLQSLGLGAYVAVSLLMGLAVKPEFSSGRRVLLPFLLISFSSLLQCVWPKKWLPAQIQNPGGVLGRLSQEAASYLTGDWGALWLNVVILSALIILAFRIPLISGAVDYVTRLLKSSKDSAAGLAGRVKLSRPPALPFSQPVSAGSMIPAPIRINENDETQERSGDTKDEELIRFSMPRSFKPAKAVKPPKLDTNKGGRAFSLPPLELLSGKAEAKSKPVDKNWYLEKGNILVQKLKDFGVEGEVVHISPGPVITVYEFKPASGVKIKEIANLSDDLTLALSVLSVRIVAPIPGKPVVGIEIPSPHREMVFFKDMIMETNFYGPDIKIPIVLGRLASGEPVVAGLASMPHLLVAGSTGTGKSVFINTMISSLLYRYTPQQLKLILVDPKMVELSGYEGIPHLLLPVVVDSKKAAMALRWAVDEMERRYTLMHRSSTRHIDAYNEKLPEMQAAYKKREEAREPGAIPEEAPAFMPYIVVVIDEYADLMAVVPKDVELSISRLAQKARASGIHLVLATQRPSTDVVTGTIKANFPSRISFRVASSVDSKTILDRTGADRLLGNGDLLFHSPGLSTLKRMQGAFLSDADLSRVVESLKAQGEPEYDERLLLAQDQAEEDGGSASGGDDGDEGALYDRAVRLVTDKGEASISLIQRHLKIGYNRAAALMEEMEKEGVVAQSTGASKRRAVLVNQL